MIEVVTGAVVGSVVQVGLNRAINIVRAVLDRDWPTALDPMPLPHAGGSATRVYAPPSAFHPLTRILDDERSKGQFFAPSPRYRAEHPGGQVVFDDMAAAATAARLRNNPAINARSVQPGRATQGIFG